jgi:predicted PurR-regulated permease PerM
MKNHNFPALCFLLLSYCAVSAIIALAFAIVAVVWQVSRSLPNTGINAQSLAPIFDPVPSIDTVKAVTNSILTRAGKKPKTTISNLIREEATRRVS